ncbi:MAG: HAD-IIA family hydrolase [Nocardioides sp.]|uniref:HAD-IIA family hydrolase n=1 Tax=Nocardioides sp. TaxID=35761 RepID=UPI003F00A414
MAHTHDVFMFDLDGVVKVGSQPVPGAADHIAALRAEGGHVAYVTNNASRSAAAVAEQLRDFGIDAQTDDVVTSAQAAASLVAERYGRGAQVLLLGADGLRSAAQEAGLVETHDPDAAVALMSGYAPDVRWSEIMEAAVLVRAGLPYVASNTDSTIPTPLGVAPGHGTLVHLISTFAGVEPTVAGKPSPPLLLETVARTRGERPLMVGDRLDTDIAGAHAVGVASLLVMTGVTGLTELVGARGELRPTYVSADLRGLLEAHAVPEVTAPGVATVNGWRAAVEDGRLCISGEGDEGDWLRAAAAAAWTWTDRTGETADVSDVSVPPGFLTRPGR